MNKVPSVFRMDSFRGKNRLLLKGAKSFEKEKGLGGGCAGEGGQCLPIHSSKEKKNGIGGK